MPLVFVHGLGSSILDWENQIRLFSQHYQVITFDVRGHGKSDKPRGPYSVSMFASDTVELIRQLHFSSVHIVGHSMGGMIAFQLAINHPELVQSMVIVNSAPELVLSNWSMRWNFFRRKLISLIVGPGKMGQLIAARNFPEPEQDVMRRTLEERWAKNDRWAYLRSLNAIIGWSISDKLDNIRCPTLIVGADQDYTSVDYKRSYVKKIKTAELSVIHDSRHMTPIDQSARFNEILMGFFEKQS